MKKVLTHIVLIISSFIFIFPFAWMVISTTNKSIDVTSGSFTLGSNFLVNFQSVLSTDGFLRIYFNSIIIGVLATAIALVVTSLAAYAFQIFVSKRREALYNFILMSMMIPFAALMIPLYKQTVSFGFLNTYFIVILQAGSGVFLLFFFRQALKSFPVEMIEAARIDGAGELMIFSQIVVPSMKTTYAAAAIYAFMASWNNYLYPLLVLKSPEMKTLPLAIASLSSSNTPDYGAIMMMIVLSTLPMLIIFFVLQKHFVEGMVGSAK